MSSSEVAVEATFAFSQADQSVWDAIVIGAGVAGASAGILLARAGLRVLLIDAKAFPREKVCGGCLNRRAQMSLQRIGVLDRLIECGAVPITELHLRLPHDQVTWAMPKMLSIRRSTLDAFLVRVAIEEGADFLPETFGALVSDPSATDSGYRHVQLANRNEKLTVTARCVIVADGLTRSSLRNDESWNASISTDSRIGVQTIAPQSAFGDWESRRLWMVAGKHGYVGISAVDGGRIDIAAAINPRILNRNCGPREAVEQILNECNVPNFKLDDRELWRATPALTRRSLRTSGRRVFLLGDAIGYVEPFTGEGMSWALASAEGIIPYVVAVLNHWSDPLASEWNRWIQKQTKSGQQTCRLLARCLRSPMLTAWVLTSCRWLPPLRHELLRRASQ